MADITMRADCATRARRGPKRSAGHRMANVMAVLKAGGMEVGDIVKTNVFLTRATDVAASRKHREEALKGVAAPGTLLIILALAHPDLLIEVDAIAARPV